MTKTQIQERLRAIDDRIELLEEEKQELLENKEVYDRWTPAATEQKVRAKVLSRFGALHNIKIALFKANSEYNDEGYNYSPCLILIDSMYNEVDHKISLSDMTPDDDDQHEYYDAFGEDLHIDDVTVRF